MVSKTLLDHALSPPKKPRGPAPKDHIYQVVTPLWNKEMGERLRAARCKLGLGQMALAQMLGTSQSVLSRVERGVLTYIPVSVTRLATTLGGELLAYVLIAAGADKVHPGLSAPRYYIKAKGWTRKGAPDAS